MPRASQVILLSAVYVVIILAFLGAYLAIRLRLRWSVRAIVAVVAVMAACELGAFLFLLWAAQRHLVP